MKKYILSLSALVSAIAFSAFNKPYVLAEFKLIQDPITGNIVNVPDNWSLQGITFGRCDIFQNDIACTISLNSATQAAYFHFDGDKDVLNTFNYANAQSPKQNYLDISEGLGLNFGGGIFDRIILSIQPKRFDGITYISVSLGADLNWRNARN
jgi:hypothetical protein